MDTAAVYTAYSRTPASGNTSACAQIFTGTKTLVAVMHDVKTDNQFASTLQDNVRKR